MNFTNVITIAVVGEFSLLMDIRFSEQIMSLSGNYVPSSQLFYSVPEYHFSMTLPLEYDFCDRKIVLRSHPAVSASKLRQYTLFRCHGVIVNLSQLALNLEYWPVDKPLFSILREYVEAVYESMLPTVFAIEDIAGLPVYLPKWVSVEHRSQNGGTNELDKNPHDYFILEDDIWSPSSPTMQAIRPILKVPARIPLLPYSHKKPESIENILKTLLAMIKGERSPSAELHVGI